ncbi:hypothetical protein BU26DRAFT_516174 [Trematosphaeria pertusa]|uniref:Uncharacterized protein n=1 Tax=Trematosphaeria pertusa TaxID=390896 RepID=A0A6A6IU20_9PLEO|nr:uncharacterized protein BU26DRAFT_516174 [Trematosphaeria pertusa]KAF2253906.1 hypothetical protein BU26DRAFT_516174 [Trematosphaeria pertusa]
MADARAILSTVLYCAWWPTSKLLLAIRAILSPFWAILQFVFLPLIYLVHAILAVILLPFRLHLLERFETIYIWLGIASLIGCVTGGALFLLFRILSSALNIDAAAAESKTRDRGRTAKEYRAARHERKRAAADGFSSSSSTAVHKAAKPDRRGLSSQTIIEEESEF